MSPGGLRSSCRIGTSRLRSSSPVSPRPEREREREPLPSSGPDASSGEVNTKAFFDEVDEDSNGCISKVRSLLLERGARISRTMFLDLVDMLF